MIETNEAHNKESGMAYAKTLKHLLKGSSNYESKFILCGYPQSFQNPVF